MPVFPRDLFLGLFFLVYITDIVDGLNSNIHLFADDTSLNIIVDHSISAAATPQSDIVKISNWVDKWFVTFTPSKSETIITLRKTIKPYHLPLLMHNQPR